MTSSDATVVGWGRYRPARVRLVVADDMSQLESLDPGDRAAAGRSAPGDDPTVGGLIARGLGRSYGDAAQRTGGTVLVTTACTGARWVDRAKGVVSVDAGVTIGALIDIYAPKGWFVPVSPGTRHVTIGGAIAADIHGKNHHIDGSFAMHVRSMTLRLASDELVRVGPNDEPALFWATVGGMGLTGVIVAAELQLVAVPSTTVRVETQRLAGLEPLLAEMRRSDEEHTFSVAWVDLIGGVRSVLTQGSFATPHELAEASRVDAGGRFQRPPTPSVALPPVRLPRVVRTPAVRAFNRVWWRKAPALPTVSYQSVTAFFHPLDAIRDWNRLYGATGFVQWQCAIPDDAALAAVIDRLRHMPSFFTVLKRFGPANDGPLSFPMRGWTLAVDLPATDSVMGRLPAVDGLVAEAGGRIYLAKDARMARSVFEEMYPRLAEWKAVRSQVDPTRRFSSDLAVRLGL